MTVKEPGNLKLKKKKKKIQHTPKLPAHYGGKKSQSSKQNIAQRRFRFNPNQPQTAPVSTRLINRSGFSAY